MQTGLDPSSLAAALAVVGLTGRIRGLPKGQLGYNWALYVSEG